MKQLTFSFLCLLLGSVLVCTSFVMAAGSAAAEGIIQDEGKGAVFCNPPYGREIGKWVKKAYDEAQKGITIVLLIPARTDTKYFHNYIYGKARIRFICGRLKFTDENGQVFAPAPFPSMVVIYNGLKNE